MSGTPAVQVDTISHRYAERFALRAVSFDVPPATVFALLGPNGSGKSTLFRILATLMLPSEGSARILGLDVAAARREVRRRIGVVFQHPSLDPKLTVAENLRHQGHMYGLSGRSLIGRIDELLARFGLNDRAAHRVETLSGGLKRRVELAKSLLHAPRVLILDEPSTGLDPAARASLMDFLHQLRDQDRITTLLTTHLMDEADRCDCIGVLDDGRLMALDAPAVLKRRIGGEVVTISCRDPAAVALSVKQRFGLEATASDGAVRVEHESGHALVPRLIEAFPGEIDSVTVGRPTLDDVFFHLTGHRLWSGPDAQEGAS